MIKYLIHKRLTLFIIMIMVLATVGLPVMANGQNAGSSSSTAASASTAASPKTSAVSATPASVQVISDMRPIGTVTISKRSNFSLKQLTVLKGDDSNLVTFTVTVNNGDEMEMQFIDYWLKITNKLGTQFSVNLLPADKDKNIIPAHSSVDFHFYAHVNLTTNLRDLTFHFIKWNFNLSNYEQELGKIAIPSTFSDITPVNAQHLIPVPGTTLRTQVNDFIVNVTSDTYMSTVDFAIENVGLKSVQLPALNFFIYTGDGVIYPLDAPSASNLTIAPRMGKVLELHAAIPNSIRLKNWKLVITQVDSTLNESLAVAKYMLPPAGDKNAGGSDSQRDLDIAGTTVNTSITRASISRAGANYLSNIFFTFTNNGTQQVILPNYSFAVENQAGLNYTMMVTGLDHVSLNPHVSKEIQLSVSIPNSVDINNLVLLLQQPSTGLSDSITTNAVTYPIASYKVPNSIAQDVSLGVDQPFTDQSGSYAANLTAVQRLPWDDQDILTGDLTLTNYGASSVSLPSLQGYFLLDGTIQVTANLIQMDDTILLPPNGTVSYVLMGKVPYNTQFQTVNLVLQEKTAAANADTVAVFVYNADVMSLPSIAQGVGLDFKNIGKTAEVKVVNALTYSGISSDLDYFEVTIKNLEKRYISPNELAGYLKTQDDQYFPVTFANISQTKIVPNGDATLALWSELPKGYNLNDFDLMIGLATSGSNLAANATGNAIDGYVRAADMKLPTGTVATNTTLSNLALQPYTANLMNPKVSLASTTGFTFSFNYTLAKNAVATVDSSSNLHKMVVEITNSSGNKYDQELDLNPATASTSTGLSLGAGSVSYTVSIANQTEGVNFVNAMSSTTNYTLTIYDEYQGFRRVISSSARTWY